MPPVDFVTNNSFPHLNKEKREGMGGGNVQCGFGFVPHNPEGFCGT